MREKLVSIILPTYNRAYILEEAVESIRWQTYPFWELVIIDDGSTDDTKALAEKLQAEDERIFYYQTPGNQGACAARNMGVEKARGEYIAFQDSDDLWLEHKLKEQLAFMDRHQADMVFCALLVEQENNKPVRLFPPEEEEGTKTYERLLLRSIGSTQTFLGKKECFTAHPFDQAMPRMQDWDVLLRIGKAFSVAYQAKGLVLVRGQEDSLTQKTSLGLKAYEKIYEKHQQMIELSAQIKGMHVLLEGHLRYLNGENPAVFYKNSLKLDLHWKVKAKILSKYLLAKGGLLPFYYSRL